MINKIKKKVSGQNNIPKKKKDNSRLVSPDQYHLYVSENEVIIINNNNQDMFMHVNRVNCKFEFFPKEKLAKYKMEKPLKIFGVYGKIEIKDIEFLILISKAETAGTINGCQLYKIRSVKFLTISKQKYRNFEYEKCWDYLERMKKFLKDGFYFSFNYNLFDDFKFNNQNKPVDWNNIFIWNAKVVKPLVESKAQLSFFIPCIQGFIGEIEAPDFSLLVLSRRSYLMGGTRYNSRGIDSNGYVANYTETEQFVETKNNIFVYKQLRGSIPFYWEQKGIKAKVQIHQTLDINVEKFNLHMEIMNKNHDYGKIVFFNLLNNKRSMELQLTKYLEEVIRKSVVSRGLNNLSYEHADFHNINKETDFTAVNEYIYKLFDNSIGYSKYDFDLLSESLEQTREQKGVIRSNCLDCLDRTNAVQTKFAFLFLYQIMKTINSQIYDSKFDNDCLLMQEQGEIEFINKFRILWADNGDAISKIYTGTGATTSSVTRKGNKSNITSVLDHGFKTISRFYINNFDDDFKQEIIDIMTNSKASSIMPSKRFNTNTDKKPAKVAVISVVNNKNSSTIMISDKLLMELFIKSADCDFIIFCSKMSGVKKIEISCEDYQVYENFEILFKTMDHLLSGFRIVNVAESGTSQVIIFAKPDKTKHVSYFKFEKAKPSTFSGNVGIKSSFILCQYAIELFTVSLENKMLSNVQDSTEKMLNKYIDKYYDFIFVVGSIEDGLELDNVNKNYTLVFEEGVKSTRIENKSNQIHLLCAKTLIEKDLEPMYQPINIDVDNLKGEVTINCHSFVILTD